jgi:hypothetical protein
MADRRGVYVLVGKYDGNGLLGRCKDKWKENFKTDLRQD